MTSAKDASALTREHVHVLEVVRSVLSDLPVFENRVFRTSELPDAGLPCALVYSALERDDISDDEQAELRREDTLYLWIVVVLNAKVITDDEDDLDSADEMLEPVLDEVERTIAESEKLRALANRMVETVREIEGTSDERGSLFWGSLMFEVTIVGGGAF